MHVALLTHQLTPLFHLRSKEVAGALGALAAHAGRQPSLSLMVLTMCPASNALRWGRSCARSCRTPSGGRWRRALLDQQSERVGGERLKAGPMVPTIQSEDNRGC